MKILRLAAIAAIAIVLVAAPPTLAAGRGGQGGGHQAGHFQASRAFVGHPGFEGHRGFEGRRDFDWGHHFGGVIIGAPFYWAAPDYGYYAPAYVPPAYVPPAYVPPASYWYYCPSYGAYYPNVATCPEAWVPVPAS